MRPLALVLLVLTACSTPEMTAIHKPGLDNAHWLTGNVLSGAQPEGDAAFGELAALGVKTVISVDGAKPDADAARRHGLRTVHLPIGYDGVPADRAKELAKAILELPGPVYIHCHHGLHRSPAAAAVACVVAGQMGNEQAVEVMKTLGTGPQYLGLWACAREARPAAPSVLRDLKVDFREVAPIPPLAASMVALDEVLDRLQVCANARWKKLDPAREALTAREILAEILRTDDCRSRPEDFRRWMDAARAAAERLESTLCAAESPELAFAALKRTCSDCHNSYRSARSLK